MSLCLRLVVISVIVTLLPGSTSLAAQAGDLDAWATAFPRSLDHDLPAMTLPAGDFPIEGLVAVNGRMLRPIEEAASFAPVLGVDTDTLLGEMRESGWETRYVGEVVRPETGSSGSFSVGGWSSVAEHEDAAGALDGFALLDESGIEGVEVVTAPTVGEVSRLTRYTGTDGTGRSFERLRLTFVSDRLIGSVALFWFDDARAEALPPDALVPLAGRLLERMQAVVAGDTSSLPGRVVRMDPTAQVAVDGHLEGYHVLDGEVIPRYGDTPQALLNAELFREQWDVEANYMARTAYLPASGAPAHGFYLVQLLRLGDAADAAELVRQHARYDQTLDYRTVEELTDLPDADGAVAGIAYTAAWDDGSAVSGYRIWVQSGATVIVLEASATGGVDERLMFDLVDRQVACVSGGSCAPGPVPLMVTSGQATPAA